MIGKKMQDALNKQVNAELYSSYLYLSMAAYFQAENLPGFAGWMRVQAREEVAHAVKIFDHIVERGGRALLAAIEAPPTKWASPLAAFEAAGAHEKKVTGMIDALSAQAEAAKDRAGAVFLQWFVSEQVEEEASVDAVVGMLKLAGDAKGVLLMLDAQLGKRAGE